MEMVLKTTYIKPKRSLIDSESLFSEKMLMISTTPSTETTQDTQELVKIQSQLLIQTVPPSSQLEQKTWLLLKLKK